MTFNPAVPLDADSPAIFPPQNRTNMARIQTIVGVDHQFNLSAAANDGYHNLIHMTPQAPVGALPGYGRCYVKSVGGVMHLFYMDDAGNEFQISPTMPIRAAVNFEGTGLIGQPQLIRSSYNVSSVVKNASGSYTVNFPANAIPNTNYIVQITGMRDVNGLASIGSVAGGIYATSVTTSALKITFSGETNSSSGINTKDVVMGNVTVFSVS